MQNFIMIVKFNAHVGGRRNVQGVHREKKEEGALTKKI